MTSTKKQPTDRDVIAEKMRDAMVPGFEATFDPEQAQYAGAFEEDALTAADATASINDIEGDS